jgi:hypothetical protein
MSTPCNFARLHCQLHLKAAADLKRRFLKLPTRRSFEPEIASFGQFHRGSGHLHQNITSFAVEAKRKAGLGPA